MTDQKPSDRVAAGSANAGDLALMDQARAEARDDLAKLQAAFAGKASPRDGGAAAVTWLVQAILDSPSWGRLELASVLGEAVVLLESLASPKGDGDA